MSSLRSCRDASVRRGYELAMRRLLAADTIDDVLEPYVARSSRRFRSHCASVTAWPS
jgi:hypothetical protein